MTNLSPLTAIILAGLVAGTIDIGAASLINGRDPVFISQIIAGGLLGKAALTGGMQSAVLGVVLQWAMSMIIAAIFVVASGWWPVLRQHWALPGHRLRRAGLFHDGVCRDAAFGLAPLAQIRTPAVRGEHGRDDALRPDRRILRVAD